MRGKKHIDAGFGLMNIETLRVNEKLPNLWQPFLEQSFIFMGILDHNLEDKTSPLKIETEGKLLELSFTAGKHGLGLLTRHDVKVTDINIFGPGIVKFVIEKVSPKYLKFNLLLINAPLTHTETNERTLFWEQFKVAVKEVKSLEGEPIILGDFNAILGQDVKPIVRKICSKKHLNIPNPDISQLTCINGIELLQTCYHLNLKPVNYNFNYKNRLINTEAKTVSILRSCILVDKKFVACIKNIFFWPKSQVISDYNILMVETTNLKGIVHYQSSTKQISDDYKLKTSEVLERPEEPLLNINQKVEKMESMKKSELIMENISDASKNFVHSVLKDDPLKENYKQELEKRVWELSDNINVMKRKRAMEWENDFKHLLSKGNLISASKRVKLLNETLQNLRKEPISKKCISDGSFAQYFEFLFGKSSVKVTDDLLHGPKFPEEITISGPPMMREIKYAIFKINDRSTQEINKGEKGSLKKGSHMSTARIFEALNKSWNGVSQQITNAEVFAFYKKGSREDVHNYRCIFSVNFLSKVLGKIIEKRLIKLVNLRAPSQSQYGFKVGCSRIEPILILRQIQCQARAESKQCYVLFIDIHNAFDAVPRELIWQLLDYYGCPKDLLTSIKGLYNFSEVRIGNASFTMRRGIKQGCTLSPQLFLIVFNYLLQLVKSDPEVNIGYETTSNGKVFRVTTLEYADDLAVISPTLLELQNFLNKFVKVFGEFGLDLSTKKTKWMNIGAIKEESGKLEVDNLVLEKANSFCYLGSEIHEDGSCGPDVIKKIEKLNETEIQVKDFLACKEVCEATRQKAANLVLSQALWEGSESWSCRQTDLDKLDVAFNKIKALTTGPISRKVKRRKKLEKKAQNKDLVPPSPVRLILVERRLKLVARLLHHHPQESLLNQMILGCTVEGDTSEIEESWAKQIYRDTALLAKISEKQMSKGENEHFTCGKEVIETIRRLDISKAYTLIKKLIDSFDEVRRANPEIMKHF